jgi:hypothetical protein
VPVAWTRTPDDVNDLKKGVRVKTRQVFTLTSNIT